MLKEKYRLDYLNSISGGDAVFIDEMIQTFISNVPGELIKIRQLAENKEWRQVGAEAHRFASNLVFLELDKLRSIAVEIEIAGMSQMQTEKILGLLTLLEEGCNYIIQQLKHDFFE
jgi:HPt (histidine-containing phosphotransfer) domain-containing protein